MFARLFLLFTTLTLLELYLLVRVGGFIGAGPTVALVVLTAFAGAWLARREGLRVLLRAQAELNRGAVPADPVVDGVCIVVAASLLVTPGLLTDALGFALLTPGFRAMLKRGLMRRFRKWAEHADFRVVHHQPGPQGPPHPHDADVVDVTVASQQIRANERTYRRER